MSERITEIHMQAFRGVPETFTLDLAGGRSCVVVGDNATGKSSIVDAIEWYFRGSIDFLTKEGRRDAIRHTGAPSELRMRVSIRTDGVLGGAREEKGPAPTSVTAIRRSELPILRGRTLSEFVEKPKGEKFKALAELLGFDDIDDLRLDLQHAKNQLQRGVDEAKQVLSEKTTVLSALIPDPSNESILAGLRDRCAKAEVAVPYAIEDALDPNWWKGVAPDGGTDQKAGALEVLVADVRALSKEIPALDPIDAWNRFVESESVDLVPLELHRAAEKILASGQAEVDRCPLCRQPMEHSVLAARVTGVLRDLEQSATALEEARREAQRLVSALTSMRDKRSEFVKRAKRLGLNLDRLPSDPADEFRNNVSEIAQMCREDAEKYKDEIGKWDSKVAVALEAQIPPSVTEREKVLVEIGVLHTRAIEWRHAIQGCARAASAYGLADRIFSAYQDRQNAYLTQTLEQISNRCAEIYAFLHPGEGVSSVAVGVVGEKGAELSVNFFGNREQPVQRVLSESHLSSLGLALFLAMAETFNDSLGFLVLDDVLNSFDRNHRGRLAELLTTEFGSSQLIVLTHDEQFFTRISLLAPSWIRHQLTSWSFLGGPRAKVHDGDRVLRGAKNALDADDRIGAAQKGRRALEHFLQEACEELEALLPFRRGSANDRRMAEEVMNGLRRMLKARAKGLYKSLDPLLKRVEADLQAALNVEAHASQSAASNQEIADALSRIDELIQTFTCTSCATRVWHTGSPAWARCSCGQSSFPPPSTPAGC